MIHGRSGHRCKNAAVVVAALALLSPSVAAAGERPPPDELAAVSVYREQIPTASGPHVADASATSMGGVPLAASAAAALAEAGPDAKSLERAATAPAYGAPTRRLTPADPGAEDHLLGSAVETMSAAESGRLLALVLVLAAITAALGAAAVRARRG